MRLYPIFSVSLICSGDPDSGAGGGSSTGHKKRYQRVEILKIAEPCPLIDPSQVVVTQGEILVADPVLTPIGTCMIGPYHKIDYSIKYSLHLEKRNDNRKIQLRPVLWPTNSIMMLDAQYRWFEQTCLFWGKSNFKQTFFSKNFRKIAKEGLWSC